MQVSLQVRTIGDVVTTDSSSSVSQRPPSGYPVAPVGPCSAVWWCRNTLSDENTSDIRVGVVPEVAASVGHAAVQSASACPVSTVRLGVWIRSWWIWGTRLLLKDRVEVKVTRVR